MRTSTLLTVASLFLIGAYSLPQPERLEASEDIEKREAKADHDHSFDGYEGSSEGWKDSRKGGSHPAGAPPSNGTETKQREARAAHIPSFDGYDGTSEGWKDSKKSGSHPAGPPPSNSTEIKERDEHHDWPDHNRADFFQQKHSANPGTNSTTLQERQAPPPDGGEKSVPPDGMTWKEYLKHGKHKAGSSTLDVPPPLSTGAVSELSTGYGGTNGTEAKMMM